MKIKNPGFKNMCEHISNSNIFTDKRTGLSPTSDAIWNSSPTGELYHIFDWYIMACSKIGKDYFGESFSIKEFNAELEKQRSKLL